MTLKELVGKHAWDEVEGALARYYVPNAGYPLAYERLRKLESAPAEGRIVVQKAGDSGVEVLYGAACDVGDDDLYGLDFTDWRECLGMEIDPLTLEWCSGPEILAHVLWEITFYGYSNEEVQAKKSEFLDNLRVALGE